MLEVLQVQQLNVFYGTSQVLFGMHLNVRQGETLALLGRNGAGKSTTMKAIAGVIPARAGSVSLHGQSVWGQPTHLIAQIGRAHV